MAITMPAVRLILSYILDWIVIIAIAAIGGGLNFAEPYKRPFSLLDLDISYPYVDESISTATLVVVSLIATAVIVFLVVLILVPGPRVFRASSRATIIRLKLWEIEKGWAGLALSCATAFFITQGMKNLFGKPRPDMLARCQPDVDNIAKHVVGGLGKEFNERWQLVSATICTNQDSHFLDDGFRSFPSGHSSFSWSGLLYLSLFLCSKFNIAIPHLPTHTPPPDTAASTPSIDQDQELVPLHDRNRPNNRESTEEGSSSTRNKRSDDGPAGDHEPNHAVHRAQHTNHPADIRNGAASPPNYLIIPAFIPIAVAIYISSTRYVEFYHHGFDIIVGSLIGIITAYLSFRWYHLPLSGGQGWAWGSRTRERAFGIGVGTGGYVGPEGWERGRKRSDVESGRA